MHKNSQQACLISCYPPQPCLHCLLLSKHEAALQTPHPSALTVQHIARTAGLIESAEQAQQVGSAIVNKSDLKEGRKWIAGRMECRPDGVQAGWSGIQSSRGIPEWRGEDGKTVIRFCLKPHGHTSAVQQSQGGVGRALLGERAAAADKQGQPRCSVQHGCSISQLGCNPSFNPASAGLSGSAAHVYQGIPNRVM